MLMCVLIVPSVVLAQTYGPPAGYESMMQDMSQFEPPAGMQGMMEKGFAMLKKSVASMKKATAAMDKAIEKLTKAGYTTPAGVAESLATAKTAIATIEAATEFSDEVTDALGDFNDFVDVLDGNIESMNMLANFPRILKQADSAITKLGKNFDKVKAKFEKNNVDAADALDNTKAKVDALKATLDAAKQSAKDGKGEEAFDALENDFFPGLEDAFQSVGMLDAVNSLTKGAVRAIEKGIAQAEKMTNKVKGQGKDVSTAQNIITQSKAKLEELKAVIKLKDFNPDDAVSMVEELDDYRREFESTMEDVTGKPLQGSSSISFSSMKAPKIPKEIRDGFPKEGDSGFEKIDMGF